MDLGKIVRTVSLCGGEKCCPSVRLYGPDGISLIPEGGERFDEGEPLRLTHAQTLQLRDLLNKEYPR
jgi:hypothetical protein